jgi:hypothetical protein
MHTNVGVVDGCIRGCLAVACLVVAVVLIEQVILSLAAALLALLLAATALTRHCPLYQVLHLSTRHHGTHPQHH